MKTAIYDILLNPSAGKFGDYIFSTHGKVEIDLKDFRVKYNFDDENKKGDMIFTKFHLPLLNAQPEEKEVLIAKANNVFLNRTLINYLPDAEKVFFILFYLSVDKEFEATHIGKFVKHKKGDWIITTVSNSQMLNSLKYLENTHYKGISIFIPIEGFKSFVKTEEDSNLKSLINPDLDVMIYESVSTRLQKVFENLVSNNIESLSDMLSFQEGILTLMKTVFEQLKKYNTNKVKHNLKKGDVEALTNAERFLLKNIKQAPSINELAREAAMSATKFKNTFKNVYGKSVYKYFLDFRIEQAHKMLTEDKKSVTEIAKELGYTNLAHFSRIFKEYYGELPSKYLK